MNLHLGLRFYTSEHSWLCFHHAVKETIRGEDVHTDIDDYSDERYTGPTYCVICAAGEVIKGYLGRIE